MKINPVGRPADMTQLVADSEIFSFTSGRYSKARMVSPHRRYGVYQGSSTFQIVRATLTISMMPAGHKAILRHLEL
jgi:hypothetical protein